MPALRNLLGRLSHRRVAGLLRAAADRLPGRDKGDAPDLAPLPAAPAPPPDPAASLALSRMAWAERLWEPGCLIPGGAAEIERLCGLLPLSPATTLLLLAGRDAGGAAGTIIRLRGAWVAAHQHDPVLAEQMAHRLRPFGRRAAVLPWKPEAPLFRAGYHHHALALEPLAAGGSIDLLAPALAAALKPAAQLVVLDVVRGDGPASCPGLDRWLALEGRTGPPPEPRAVEGALQAAGFQIHVAEDAAPRQCAAVIEGWARLIGELRGAAGAGQLRGAAAGLIAEAELWLLRHRLLGTGAIGLRRWHATLRR